jgi:YfiH family protein
VIGLYHFDLVFAHNKNDQPFFAAFPFMFAGEPVSGISCGLSSRFAGDMVFSKDNQNRIDLFSSLGLEGRVCGIRQTHSRKVLEAALGNLQEAEADGLVCADSNAALSVTVADCLPVFLYDTESGAFGLVHSGWKGTGIVLDAMSLMAERWGTKSKAVAAVLGPCIDSCCYRVDAARAAFFEREFGSVPAELSHEDEAMLKPVVRHDDAGCYLDLKSANIRLLAGAGVQNIAVCNECTFTDARLGSFRREGSVYTRMAALLWQ